MSKIDFTNHKFFIKPCFICSNQTWDSYEGEYGTGGSYAICEADEHIYEVWQEEKKDFPYCESPKRCTRKGIFKFDINFDNQHICDYYNNLHVIEEALGVELSSDINDFKSNLASRIAHSVASFNQRMRNKERIV